MFALKNTNVSTFKYNLHSRVYSINEKKKKIKSTKLKNMKLLLSNNKTLS